MTETGAGGVVMATHAPRAVGIGSFGRPRNGVEARVVRDDGTEAASDEPGELLVRRMGPNPREGFFREYLKNPEATAEAWEGGWLHTGDIVARNEDGDLRFIDRKKNVIRRSGENISAAEVESVLGRNPAVRAIACAPVADEMRGEEVCALVVADGRDRPAAEALVRWSLAQRAYSPAPGWVAFVDELPRTATEKLQRGAIRELADGLVAGGAAHDCRALKRRTA
jgi:acyl-coenzyme A synthetase/AMP-(fatty) acid ligase